VFGGYGAVEIELIQFLEDKIALLTPRHDQDVAPSSAIQFLNLRRITEAFIRSLEHILSALYATDDIDDVRQWRGAILCHRLSELQSLFSSNGANLNALNLNQSHSALGCPLKYYSPIGDNPILEFGAAKINALASAVSLATTLLRLDSAILLVDP
jgi:hypothetical protein